MAIKGSKIGKEVAMGPASSTCTAARQSRLGIHVQIEQFVFPGGRGGLGDSVKKLDVSSKPSHAGPTARMSVRTRQSFSC